MYEILKELEQGNHTPEELMDLIVKYKDKLEDKNQ